MDTFNAKRIVTRSVSQAVAICGTQSLLAKKASITQGAVGKYLRGDCLPTGRTAKRLSFATGHQLSPYDFAPHIFGEDSGFHDEN